MADLLRQLVRYVSRLRRPRTDMRRDPSCTVGEWSYGNPHLQRWRENSRLVIGRFCSIADGVVIMLGGEHHTDWITTYPLSPKLGLALCSGDVEFTKGDVLIENDVWIGKEACILSGVRIGNGAVVGARAVVAKDVPPYAIVVGNPARVVRYRFSPEAVAELLRIAWWDWPIGRIRANASMLLSGNVEEFIRSFQS